jgi:hypothetical protein
VKNPFTAYASVRAVVPWPREPLPAKADRERWLLGKLEWYEQWIFDDFEWGAPVPVSKDPSLVAAKDALRDAKDALRDALWALKHGTVEPLRKLYPHIAEAINRPRRPGRGKNFPKDYYTEAMANPQLRKLTQAVWDAARIRAIWKHYYKCRPPAYLPEEIAGRRWGVSEDKVHDWKNNRRCPKDFWKL